MTRLSASFATLASTTRSTRARTSSSLTSSGRGGGATSTRPKRGGVAAKRAKSSSRKPRNEAAIVKAVIQYLTIRGCFVWRQNAGAVSGEYKGKRRFVRFSGAKGVSDIIGVLPSGRFIAVECKDGSNKVSADQQRFLSAVEAHGGLAIVARGPNAVAHVILSMAGRPERAENPNPRDVAILGGEPSL